MKIPKPRKLKSGKYFIQLRLKQPDGTTLSIPITEDSEKVCIAKAAEVKAGLKSTVRKAEPLTLGEACDAYIASNTLLSPSTVAGYKRLRRNTFQNLMGRKLRAITNDMINAEVAAMVRAGKSWKYVLNAIGLIRPAIKAYYPDFQLEIKTPTNKKSQSRTQSRAKKYALPTDQEIQQIITAAVGTEIELPILCGVWLGMRLSEIRAMRRRDIQGNMLHICSAIVDDINGQPVEKDTKSDAGDRWIELPSYILSLIPPGDPDSHIINLSGHAIYQRYQRLLEKNGIRHFRFHDLRCANAAVMIRLGIDSKYAMEHNGWSTEHMYKQVYGYIMSDKLAEESARIDQHFLPHILAAQKPPEK